jgi:cobalt-zinc-cadmium efflux system outer membrane protein
VRAAELSIQAAGEQLGLEEQSIWKISATLDMNGKGKEGFEAGPGVLLEIPIFNTNQGGQARARALMEQAMLHYISVQRNIANEIKSARDRFQQANRSYQNWLNQILPTLEETLRLARSAYGAGEISYLGVLEANRKLIENRVQITKVVSELRTSACDLDRGIGRTRFSNY